MNTAAPHSVALLGAGIIGLSWAVVFSSHGMRVRLHDPRPDVQESLEHEFGQVARLLAPPHDPSELLSRVRVVGSLAEAVDGADVVQENGPERLELKCQLFAQVERVAARSALLLSSTSGLMPSAMSRDMSDPGRLVVGHPFNPPHVVPLVEVVPGPQTPPETVQAVVALYRRLGKQPVVLRKEIGGFVANRLQSAVFQESVHLVTSGVVSMEELDEVMTSSLGPRWATAGPFESMDLGGGPGGLRHMLEHLGPGMVQRWKDLGHPDLDPELVEQLSTAAERRFADQAYDRRTARRDRLQLSVLAARDQSAAVVEAGAADTASTA